MQIATEYVTYEKEFHAGMEPKTEEED